MWNQFVRHCVKFFESVWLSHIYFQSSSWIIHRVWLGLISSLVLIKLNLDWVLQLKLFSENSNRVIVPSKRGNKSLDYNHSYLKILNCLNIFKHTMRASSWIFWKKSRTSARIWYTDRERGRGETIDRIFCIYFYESNVSSALNIFRL